ncbi:hypothetical protein [Vreelandella alkaliphila]|uniref:hypothetical protein n=1 Tax=Vreelandella alkaliphila TaxID=272774 RepID=UPI003FD8AA6D
MKTQPAESGDPQPVPEHQQQAAVVAYSESGLPLRSWIALEDLGRALSIILSLPQDISRLLLWPLLELKEGVTDPDVLSLGQVAGHYGGKRAAKLPEE